MICSLILLSLLCLAGQSFASAQATSLENANRKLAFLHVQSSVQAQQSPAFPSLFNKILPSKPPTPVADQINYILGRHVLTGRVPVYLLWYGTWDDDSIALTESFVAGLGKSSWYSVNRKYYYQNNTHRIYVSDKLELKQSLRLGYAKGKTLKRTDLPELLEALIGIRSIPANSNAMYIFALSNDVQEFATDSTGTRKLCRDYCGYHGSWMLSGGKTPSRRMYYAVVGDTSACGAICTPRLNLNVSPNEKPGVDGMLSVLAHEIAETVTDPRVDVSGSPAWFDSAGEEVADKCSWQFGSYALRRNSFGAYYNMEFGDGNQYLIQGLWDPSSRACSPV